MLELNTIADFQALPLALQAEVQKALRVKDRLDDFLRSLNNKKPPTLITPGEWVECSRCKGHPGWVWSELEPEEERDNSDIHPSQINKCLKNLYHACNREAGELEEFIEPRMRLVFNIGHAYHDILQHCGRKGAWGDPKYYHPEAKIDPDAVTHDGNPVLPLAAHYWIRGSADALIDRYEVPNVPGIGDLAIRLVHEYKSMKSGEWGKLTRPKPDHKYQATIYAAVFNVPLVVYLYVNKDTQYISDFPVPFDHLIWNEVVQKIDMVKYYVESGIMPPWEETSAVKNPQECMECGFRKLCAPPVARANASRRLA